MNFRQLFVFALFFLHSIFSSAEVLFEGYYKVTQFKKHIGFAVIRHETDGKAKTFKTTSFVRLAKQKFDMTEAYTAVSDEAFVPISLSYMAAGDKKTKTIEAKVKNLQLTGTVNEDGKKTKLNSALPKGAFFSSALYYLMLKNGSSLKTGNKFDYVGITEEGPVPMNGTVSIDKNMVSQGSLQLFKVNNQFAGSDYDNLVNARGEVLSAITPATQLQTELVKNAEEATAGIKLTAGTLEKIFGKKPEGKINSLNGKAK